MPPEIRTWVREFCFDCHSHQVRFPWYASVAPLSWWIADEVRRGRAGLNFSRWDQYTPRMRDLAWRRSLERIRQQRMPPRAYSLMHPHNLGEAEIHGLENYLKQHDLASAECLSAQELLAWPAAPFRDANHPLTGVYRLSGEVAQPLQLNRALLLCDGDLNLPGGVSGHGAIFATGKLSLGGLKGEVGPLALIGLQGISLQGSGNCRLIGLVHTPAQLQRRGITLQPRQDFAMELADVHQRHLEFCRDDGEIGERIERQAILRYGHGHYVLWDPEFQKVRRAVTLDQALAACEELLQAEPATSVARWRRRFRKSWKKQLQSLAGPGSPAVLTLRAHDMDAVVSDL
jgi:hypothetical protein